MLSGKLGVVGSLRLSRTLPRAFARPAAWFAGPAHLRADAGVTILEALATSLILGIGLVGVGSMVTVGVISHRKSVNYTLVAARATQELERVREAGYSSCVARAATRV